MHNLAASPEFNSTPLASIQAPSSSHLPSFPTSAGNNTRPFASMNHGIPSSVSLGKRPALSSAYDDDPRTRSQQVKTVVAQHLTAHGKPRERAYLACSQCRNRKVRCDGAKPECHNCLKRADPNAGQCSYDPAPRRRGKDRTPGSRKLAPFIEKRTRTTRSRLEEEAKRRKAEAAAAAAAAATTAPAVSRPVHGIPVVQDPSSSRAAYAAHAPTITRPMHPLPTGISHISGPMMPSQPFSVDPNPLPTNPYSIAGEVAIGFSLEPPPLRPVALISAHPEVLTLAQRIEQEEEHLVDSSVSRPQLYSPPGVQFTRETWWDALVSSYALSPGSSCTSCPPGSQPLTPTVRDAAISHIASDLRFFFHVSLHWFSFLHVPRFFSSVFDPHRRRSVQPSLVLAALAFSLFSQSSELERGGKGRERALQLLDQAQAAFDASLSSGWIDVGLIQAAWLLAIFEMQAHPLANSQRSRTAFRMLDSLIRALSLTTLDVDDPRVTVFVPGAVPVVPNTSSSFTTPSPPGLDPFEVFPNHGLISAFPDSPPTHPSPQSPGVAPPPFVPSPTISPQPYASPSKWSCGCSAYALGTTWPQAASLTPAWTNMPMWPCDVDPGASEGEMQKEECRRVVWATVMLTVSHSTKTTAGTDREPQHLWIKDPANYALLFPGENFTPLGMPAIVSSKDSVWALYMRTLFLWNSCLRMRGGVNMSSADRAQFAMGAWLELDNVEAAMDRHTCDIQSGFMLQMREVLFNTRMVVSNEFRRYIPEALTAPGQLFYHEKAEHWLKHLLQIAHSFREGQIQATKGYPSENTRRCFLMYWFMSHILRALSLWYADPSLTIALDVAKAFAPCVEFMMLIWPSPSQRREYEGLRNWLVRSCQIAGVPPPVRAIPVPPRPPSSQPLAPAPDPALAPASASASMPMPHPNPNTIVPVITKGHVHGTTTTMIEPHVVQQGPPGLPSFQPLARQVPVHHVHPAQSHHAHPYAHM